MAMPGNKSIRRILAVVTTLVAFACLVTAIVFALSVRIDEGIPPLLMDEVTTKSIDARLVLAQSLFQVALLMVGALWGVVFAKPGEIQIVFKEKLDMAMFFSASFVLLLSIFCYGIYLDKITHQFAEAVRARSKSTIAIAVFIPDVFDQNVDYLFKLQFVSLAAGFVNAALTLISAHRLKEKTHDH
jgi:hypothetical protein